MLLDTEPSFNSHACKCICTGLQTEIRAFENKCVQGFVQGFMNLWQQAFSNVGSFPREGGFLDMPLR